jgi:hypothetical protein
VIWLLFVFSTIHISCKKARKSPDFHREMCIISSTNRDINMKL